jgi:hypothetical protein
LCAGLTKAAEQLLLSALFFVSFFWASKRKKGTQRFTREVGLPIIESETCLAVGRVLSFDSI